ncbi:MAG: tetratricopeptide repeat protein [Candidatus Omnitrophota bacterium]
MKNSFKMITGILVFMLLIFSFGFVTGEVIGHKKIELIKQKIPHEWWHGGWEETEDFQSILSQTPQDKYQSAQAQYYLACQYYANRDHHRAVQEFRKLINDYPKAWFECQKAQFEIGQVYLYRLNQPSAAITEYEKVIDDYPDSPVKAMSQMMKGRAYYKQNNYHSALLEYEKVITEYPSYRTEVTETSLDIGDMKISQAYMENIDPAIHEQYLREAMISYQRAYRLCPLTHPELMERALDGIYRTFRCYDENLARANQFVKYQKYGKAGIDKTEGTTDDIKDPMESF